LTAYGDQKVSEFHECDGQVPRPVMHWAWDKWLDVSGVEDDLRCYQTSDALSLGRMVGLIWDGRWLATSWTSHQTSDTLSLGWMVHCDIEWVMTCDCDRPVMHWACDIDDLGFSVEGDEVGSPDL